MMLALHSNLYFPCPSCAHLAESFLQTRDIRTNWPSQPTMSLHLAGLIYILFFFFLTFLDGFAIAYQMAFHSLERTQFKPLVS